MQELQGASWYSACAARTGFIRFNQQEPGGREVVPIDDIVQRLRQLNKKLPVGVMRASDLILQEAPRKDPPDLSRFIPGEVHSVGEDTCFVSEEFFPYDQFFGNYHLQSLCNLDAVRLAEVFGLELDQPDGKILFIDTETTGLAGGTGTYAFMIGVGSLEKEGFLVTQYFMRDFDEEPAQMALLGEEIKKAALLVTYNGATFDLPLLRTRFVFNRVRIPLSEIPHLDLLPVARRLWKPAYGAANLSFLESKVLGSEREGDVPGSLIPHLYFQFLRGASPQTMAPIFYHNRMDIVALAALTEQACRLHIDPLSASNLWESLGVARYFDSRGNLQKAIEILESVPSPSRWTVEWHLCSRYLALLHKRAKNLERAASIWQSAYQSGFFDPLISIELAKYFEHTEKNYGKARELVIEVFSRYNQKPKPLDQFQPDEEETEDDLRYEYIQVRSVRRRSVTYSTMSDDRDEDDLPIIHSDRFDSNEIGDIASCDLPHWTERLERDLNHRLQRLIRKIEHSRS